MGILDLFRSKPEREKLGHIKALIALSLADGRIDKNELKAIIAVCHRENISESEIRRCIIDPDSIQYVQPKDDETKVRYLKDMVCIMMSDGDINDEEIALCKLFAESLGFRKEVIDAMIIDIIKELKKKLDRYDF